VWTRLNGRARKRVAPETWPDSYFYSGDADRHRLTRRGIIHQRIVWSQTTMPRNSGLMGCASSSRAYNDLCVSPSSGLCKICQIWFTRSCCARGRLSHKPDRMQNPQKPAQVIFTNGLYLVSYHKYETRRISMQAYAVGPVLLQMWSREIIGPMCRVGLLLRGIVTRCRSLHYPDFVLFSHKKRTTAFLGKLWYITWCAVLQFLTFYFWVPVAFSLRFIFLFIPAKLYCSVFTKYITILIWQ